MDFINPFIELSPFDLRFFMNEDPIIAPFEYWVAVSYVFLLPIPKPIILLVERFIFSIFLKVKI